MKCFHCNQKIIIPITANIENKDRVFCCNGCLSACKIIKNNHLGGFYKQKTNTLNPIFNNQYPLEYYDLPEFESEFIIDNKIILITPSIHCAACIWLIEKTLSAMPEVKSVRGNLSNYRLNIELESSAKLSGVMKQLAKIGYSSEPLLENNLEIARDKQNKILLGKIGFAGFSMMNLLWISISLYTGADTGKYNNYFLWLSFALATPTLFYSGSHILKSSWQGLKNHTLNMDTPISIGALATYIYSSLVLFGVVDGDIYFDTVVNFIFVILIGRYLEASVKKSALKDSNSFGSIVPKFASKIENGVETLVAIATLKFGSEIIIKTGDKIAIDGIIISGNLSVDEAIITGESLPIVKNIGDKVFAGTLNNSGNAIVKVGDIKNSTINTIKKMVENASFSKPKIECVIDKFIPYFVISTISIAILAFIFNFNFVGTSFDLALLSGVSILIITCPCAFGIAVPITNSIAISKLLKHKIIIKNSNILEKILTIDTVVFDKTGTLTTGDFEILNINSKIDEIDFMNIIASISKNSNHPISKAIAKYYSNSTLDITGFSEHSGLGISAKIGYDLYKIGSADFVGSKGKASIYCSKNDEIIGEITLSDTLNINAREIVEFLQNQGKKVVILSGDNQLAVQNIAKKLQIEEFYFSQKPADKLNFIKNLQKNNRVLMIGDGVNDAPALALADCSIAISGIDIAADKADSLILKNNLIKIKTLWKISTKSKKIILQNIIFALGYNAIFVPLAFMGIITPLFAAIVMPVSSIVVILNAMRVKKID